MFYKDIGGEVRHLWFAFSTDGKRKIVGVDGVTDEEDYRGYQEMPPFGANVPLPILQEGDEPAFVWLDHSEALIVVAPKDG